MNDGGLVGVYHDSLVCDDTLFIGALSVECIESSCRMSMF